MSAIDRAAEVIRSMFQFGNGRWQHNAAQALADAGLLVTDEMRAVIDAAVAVKTAWAADDVDLWMDANVNLLDAVDAYIAAGDDQ